MFLRTRGRVGLFLPGDADATVTGGQRWPDGRRRVDHMDGSGVYRTESGMIFRVSEDEDGHLSVGILEGSTWVDARIGVVGLRRSPTTVRLTAKQVLRLPA